MHHQEVVVERLLTFDQLEERTGIPAGTWRYWRHVGEGPESFRIGRRVYVPESKYQEWFDQMTASQHDEQLAG